MSKSPDNLSANPEEDPALQRIRRKLVRLMLASIIITFVLVGLVLMAIIYKIMTPAEQATSRQPLLEQQINLEGDGHIVSYKISGDILILQTRSADKGNEFIFYDYRLQRVISHLRIVSDNL